MHGLAFGGLNRIWQANEIFQVNYVAHAAVVCDVNELSPRRTCSETNTSLHLACDVWIDCLSAVRNETRLSSARHVGSKPLYQKHHPSSKTCCNANSVRYGTKYWTIAVRSRKLSKPQLQALRTQTCKFNNTAFTHQARHFCKTIKSWTCPIMLWPCPRACLNRLTVALPVICPQRLEARTVLAARHS